MYEDQLLLLLTAVVGARKSGAHGTFVVTLPHPRAEFVVQSDGAPALLLNSLGTMVACKSVKATLSVVFSPCIGSGAHLSF